MKTRFVSLLSAWFFSITILVADDFLIVVDATRSMNFPIVRPGKIKKPIVKEALVEFLKELPEDNHRVYIYFFNDGTKEDTKKFLFKEGNVNDGKKAALEFAGRYEEFIDGHHTHLWSSFHKALKFAEDEEWYRKDGANEKFPNIILLTDGGDDQETNKKEAEGTWVFKDQEPGKPNRPTITENHPWFLKLKAAQWFQVGTDQKTKKMIKFWRETGKKAVVITDKDKKGKKLIGFKFPPSIRITGEKLESAVGKNRRIPAGENISLMAAGKFDQFKWEIRNEAGKVVDRETADEILDYKFENAGTYNIKLIGTDQLGDLEASTYIEVFSSLIVIKPDFTMKHGDNVFQDKGVVWMGDRPATISFDPSKTTTVPADKVKEFVYDWTIKDKNGKKLEAVKDNSADFTVGGVYTIELNATDSKTKQSEVEEKTLTLWQVKPAFMAKYGDEPLPDGGTAWMGDNNKTVITLGDETKSSPNLNLDIKWDGKVKVQDGKAIIKEPGKYIFTLTASDPNAPANKTESDPQTFTVKKVVPNIKVGVGDKPQKPIAVIQGRPVRLELANQADFPKGIGKKWMANNKLIDVNNGLAQFNMAIPQKVQLEVTLPDDSTIVSNPLNIKVLPLVAGVIINPINPWRGQQVQLIAQPPNVALNDPMFDWKFDQGGKPAKGKIVNGRRFLTPGANKGILTITDDNLPNKKVTYEFMVVVKPITPMPIAVDHPEKIYIGSKLLFEDKAKFPDNAAGLKIQRTWDFGDKNKWKFWFKNVENGQKTATIYYTEPGKHQTTLEVTLLDEKGNRVEGIEPIKKDVPTVETLPIPFDIKIKD